MKSAVLVSRRRVYLVALAVAVTAFLLAGMAWQLASTGPGAKQASAAVGIRISMTVTGAKQGAFKGDDNAAKNRQGTINVTNFQFEAISERDASTGLPTGKRQYKPVVVTHQKGGSSPEFLAALDENEVLKSVVINFYRNDKSGKEINYYRVTLTNATVSDVREYTTGNIDLVEDDSFTFQKLEEDDLVAKTSVLIDLTPID